MKLILPLVLLLAGVGSGVGAGLFFKPDPVATDTGVDHDCVAPADTDTGQIPIPAAVDVAEDREFVKLNNQFVIPVVEDSSVAALVVMSLNLEVTIGSREAIFAAEPKLRDRFLQVMFDHANIGGFSGNFTTGTNMRALRNELLRVAQEVSSDRVTDVLVIDIVRQDS